MSIWGCLSGGVHLGGSIYVRMSGEYLSGGIYLAVSIWGVSIWGVSIWGGVYLCASINALLELDAEHSFDEFLESPRR